MNQPCGCCITSCLCIEPCKFFFPDLNADGDINDNWEDIDSGFDLPVNDLTKEVLDPTEESQTREPEPFIELYSGASASYGHGHIFMDAFNAD